MIPFLRMLPRHLPSLTGRGAGRSARAIAVCLVLMAGSARAEWADGGTDAIYAAIAAIVAGPPLVVALAVARLRGVLQWLGLQVVWVGLLTIGFQVFRAVSAMP